MTPAHITRLMTFAEHAQPLGYAASDLMRTDLEAVITYALKWASYKERKDAAIKVGLGRSPLRQSWSDPLIANNKSIELVKAVVAPVEGTS